MATACDVVRPWQVCVLESMSSDYPHDVHVFIAPLHPSSTIIRFHILIKVQPFVVNDQARS